MENEQTTKKGGMSKPVIVVIVIVVILAILYFTGIIGKKKSDTLTTPNGQTQTAGQGNKLSDKEVNDILDKLAKVMVIPDRTVDKPVVATVVDPSLLRNEQPFYKDIQKDDVLIIFPVNARAIIFRPSNSVVVNVGPIQVGDQNKTPAPGTPTQAPTQQKAPAPAATTTTTNPSTNSGQATTTTKTVK